MRVGKSSMMRKHCWFYKLVNLFIAQQLVCLNGNITRECLITKFLFFKDWHYIKHATANYQFTSNNRFINQFILSMVDFEIKLNLPNVAPFSQLYELARVRCSVKPFERHSVKIDFSWAQPLKPKNLMHIKLFKIETTLETTKLDFYMVKYQNNLNKR